MSTATFEHGTLTGRKYHRCTCLDCFDADAAYQRHRNRQRAYGRWNPLVDATPARDHIEALHAQGMPWKQIARAAGVTVEDLRRMRLSVENRPRTERIRPEREQALLAVRFNPEPTSPQALVSVVGTMRRLQGLRVIGWPLPVLAARSGLARQTLTALSGRQPFVQAASADTVAELFDDLHDQDPRRHGVPEASMRRTMTWAARQGWAAPNRWHDSDIDIVVTVPGPPVGRRYSAPSNGDRRQAIVEDTAELAAVGCTREVIAARLGVTWEAVHRAHLRSGVPVPAALAA